MVSILCCVVGHDHADGNGGRYFQGYYAGLKEDVLGGAGALDYDSVDNDGRDVVYAR